MTEQTGSEFGSVPTPPQPGSWQPSHGAAFPPESKRTNGLAIAGFVLSILWLCGLGSLLGLIFGAIALSQISRRNEGGRGLAIAATIIGGLSLAAMAVLLIVSAVAVDEAAVDLDEERVREARDVRVQECTADQTGDLAATLRVTNNSSKRSNYLITVSFESPGGDQQFDTALTTVTELEPGQSANANAVTFTDAPPEFRCRVVDVERFAAEP